jgi:hypothetical protein
MWFLVKMAQEHEYLWAENAKLRREVERLQAENARLLGELMGAADLAAHRNMLLHVKRARNDQQ